MNVFYDKPGFAKGRYDPKYRMIVQEFEQYSSDYKEFKSYFDACYQALVKYRAIVWMVDTKRTPGSLAMVLQDWIKNEHTPRCVQNGLKYLVTIVPDSGLGKISTRNWQSGVQQVGGLIMNNFTSVDDALKWLSEQK